MSIATDLYLLIGISLRPDPSEPSKALVEFAKGVVGTILQDQFEECDHYEVKECGLGVVSSPGRNGERPVRRRWGDPQ